MRGDRCLDVGGKTLNLCVFGGRFLVRWTTIERETQVDLCLPIFGAPADSIVSVVVVVVYLVEEEEEVVRRKHVCECKTRLLFIMWVSFACGGFVGKFALFGSKYRTIAGIYTAGMCTHKGDR